MINRTVLVGRLTKDPELKTSQSGISVVNFTLAVNRTFKSQDGQDADFINVVAFRKQAENVGQYLSKGSLAGVDGRLQSRSYENKEGVRVYVTEVVADSVQFLEPKGSNNGAQGQNNNSYTNAYGGQKQRPQPSQNAPEENPFANQDGSVDIQESELPF